LLRVVTPRLVLLLFLVAQGWDGVFTYAAVGLHGIAAEGNAILAGWMALVGPAPTLVAAKLGAAGLGAVLHVLGGHRALAGLTLFYAVAAVGPWLLIFHRYH
jgi:hypothetical protein